MRLVSRLLVLGAAVAAVAAVAAAPAGAATNECKGLMICVPVAGPWVLVPAKLSVPRVQQQFVLSCPKGYVAAGFDAELSDRAIEVGFVGSMGAPVNPGISTTGDAVFVATYVGGTARAPSFRPHVGCMPTRGGGARTPTALVFPPERLVVRHVKNVALRPGRREVAVACGPAERLIDAWHAVAFGSRMPPSGSLAGRIAVRQTIRASGTVALVTTRAPSSGNPLVQLTAVCAGGK